MASVRSVEDIIKNPNNEETRLVIEYYEQRLGDCYRLHSREVSSLKAQIAQQTADSADTIADLNKQVAACRKKADAFDVLHSKEMDYISVNDSYSGVYCELIVLMIARYVLTVNGCMNMALISLCGGDNGWLVLARFAGIQASSKKPLTSDGRIHVSVLRYFLGSDAQVTRHLRFAESIKWCLLQLLILAKSNANVAEAIECDNLDLLITELQSRSDDTVSFSTKSYDGRSSITKFKASLSDTVNYLRLMCSIAVDRCTLLTYYRQDRQVGRILFVDLVGTLFDSSDLTKEQLWAKMLTDIGSLADVGVLKHSIGNAIQSNFFSRVHKDNSHFYFATPDICSKNSFNAHYHKAWTSTFNGPDGQPCVTEYIVKEEMTNTQMALNYGL